MRKLSMEIDFAPERQKIGIGLDQHEKFNNWNQIWRMASGFLRGLYYIDYFYFGALYFSPGYLLPLFGMSNDKRPSMLGYFIFILGLGNWLGGTMVKKLNQSMTVNSSLLLCNGVLCLSMLMMYLNLKNLFVLSIVFMFAAVAMGILEVQVVTAMLELNQQDRSKRQPGIQTSEEKSNSVSMFCFAFGCLLNAPLYKIRSGVNPLVVMTLVGLVLTLGYLIVVLTSPPKPTYHNVMHSGGQSTNMKRASQIAGRDLSHIEHGQLVEMPQQVKKWYHLFLMCFVIVVNSTYALLASFYRDMNKLHQDDPNFEQISGTQISNFMFLAFGMNLVARVIGNFTQIQINVLMKFSYMALTGGYVIFFLIAFSGDLILAGYVGATIIGAGLGNLFPLIYSYPIATGYKLDDKLLSDAGNVMGYAYIVGPFAVTLCMYNVSDYFHSILCAALGAGIWFAMVKYQQAKKLTDATFGDTPNENLMKGQSFGQSIGK